MSKMMSKISKFVDPSKIRKSEHLENETLVFLQIKKNIYYTQRTLTW